jgi:hypothetical protein
MKMLREGGLFPESVSKKKLGKNWLFFILTDDKSFKGYFRRKPSLFKLQERASLPESDERCMAHHHRPCSGFGLISLWV